MNVPSAASCLAPGNVQNPKKRKIAYRNEKYLHSAVTETFIDDAFEILKCFVKSLVTSQSVDTYHNEFDVMIRVISEATDLETIINACTHLELATENDLRQGIKCKICYQDNDTLGFFKFSHHEEIYSRRKSNRPILAQKFKGLRTTVRNHLLSNNHGKSIRRLMPNDRQPVATLSYFENKIEEIKTFLKGILPSVRSVELPPQRKPQSAVSKSTSIQEILETCADLKLYYHGNTTEDFAAFDSIACVPCRAEALKKNPESKSKLGVFSYNCLLGTDFGGRKSNQQFQPLIFRQLKYKIANHLLSQIHCSTVQIPYTLTAKEKDLVSKNKKAGIIIGKLAYKAIVRYQSKTSFEEEITFMADIGVEIGEINHSVDYVSKLFSELYFVLNEETMTVLHEPVAPCLDPSPFVVFADKITPYGTTQQIIGIIIFKKEKNTPIVLDVLPVKHKIQNGAALAKDIVDTLHKFYTPESAKKLYVGCSFDGQYIALKVPTEILKLLGFAIDPEMPQEDRNKTSFHSYSWDPAHLLELACGDVKKSKLHEWVDKTEQTIVTVNRGNTYGKAYLRLIEEARQMDLVLMRPESFSDTRFSSYKFRVLNRFGNNYPMLYNTHSKDANSDLNLFNNYEFFVRLSGLTDIFKLIGETSTQIQSLELLPWECDDIIEECINELKEMAASINVDTLVTSSSWKNLGAAVEEIKTLGTFKGKAVLIKKSVYYMTRSKSVVVTQDESFEYVIQRVIAEIKFYVNSLSKSIAKRYQKNHSQLAYTAARNSFSRTQILMQNTNGVTESFVEYCELARNWGFLDTSISQDTLNNQYMLFSNQVKERHSYELETFGRLVPECQVYWEMMKSDCDREKFLQVLNLLLTLLVRNKSECVAESVGSIMKVHLDKRCNLSDKNLGMEIFLHFNGPKPNRDCNSLVRKANNRLFGKDKLHFYRSSKLSDLKFWDDHSKVVAKIHSNTGRIDVPDIGENII